MLRRALLRRAIFRRRDLPSAPVSTAPVSPSAGAVGAVAIRAPPILLARSVDIPGRHVLTGLTRRSFHSTARAPAMEPFKLFDIGEGITEVEIIKWHVTDGQEVAEFDTLCEVQSDKSSVELTSHCAGKVRKINFSEGQTVKVGQTLCSIQTGEAGAEVDEPIAVESEASPSSPAAPAATAGGANESIQRAELQSEQLERFAESSRSSETPAAPTPGPIDEEAAAAEAEASLFSAPDAAMDSVGGGRFSGEAGIVPDAPPARKSRSHPMAPPEHQIARTEADEAQEKSIVRASPAVRSLAGRLGVDLGTVKGSGENGRVTRGDVEAFASGGASATSAAAPIASSPAPASRGPVAPARSARDDVAPITTVDFGRTRKVMYRAMGEQGSVPHFGYSHTLNITPLLPYIQSLNAPIPPSKPGYLASDIPSSLVRDPLPRQKTTLLSFLVKGLLLAMEEHPIMRSRAREEGGNRSLQISRDANVGIAVSDPKFGLLTPSLPPMSPNSSVGSITSALTRLRETASKPSAIPHVTVSSVGALGEARGAMPVLPPGGGVAICAVGRARWETEWTLGKSRPMDLSPAEVEAGGMEAVLRVPVGWSGDHRVLEGAELIAFTETWKKYIEEPWRWVNVD